MSSDVPGPHQKVSYSFRPSERIRLKKDYEKIYKSGRRFSGQYATLWILNKKEVPETRLGLAVGRKYGIAVQRNRFKRRIREIFRLHKNTFAHSWDMIVSPAVRAVDREPNYKMLEQDLLDILRKAGILVE
jgi:ribonuclease P protein component